MGVAFSPRVFVDSNVLYSRVCRDWLGLPALALGALLAGCSEQAPTQRDLGAITSVADCVPTKLAEPIYFGTHPVSNVKGLAQIDTVSLTDAQGINLINSYLVRVSRRGAGADTRDPASVKVWDWTQAQPAEGATVDASSPPLTLVVEMERTAPVGTASSIRADYRIGDQRYYSVWTQSIRLQEAECSAP